MSQIKGQKYQELILAENRLTNRNQLATEEESKTGTFQMFQESIIQAQRERQVRPLGIQAKNWMKWYDEERTIVGRTLVSHRFDSVQSEYDDLSQAVFYPGSFSDDPAPEIREKWKPLTTPVGQNGLELRNKIIKVNQKATLRSIALETRIILRLQGESTFWIFTRGNGIRDQKTAICKLQKEVNCHRAVVSLGGPVGLSQEFKFFKKTELPEMDMSDQAILEDYIDVSLVYRDNGDDCISVHGHMISKIKRECVLRWDKFIPFLEDTHFMVSGHGNSIQLKSISVKQVERAKTLDMLPDPTCRCECVLIQNHIKLLLFAPEWYKINGDIYKGHDRLCSNDEGNP